MRSKEFVMESSKHLNATMGTAGDSATHLREAVLWSVDPARGDLYIVELPERVALVQLLEGGICDNPSDIEGQSMSVMASWNGGIVALPIKGERSWVRCKRLIG